MRNYFYISDFLYVTNYGTLVEYWEVILHQPAFVF